MGVLYYFAKHDGSHELFALNKFGYAATDRFHRMFSEPAPATEFAALFDEEFEPSFYARLAQWAGQSPIQYVSEYWVEAEEYQHDMSYTEHRAKITGSLFDSDYEADGVTYKPGSAW